MSGPSWTGKFHLARRLAEQADADLVEVGVVGGGQRGERTAKAFDDLMVSAGHLKMADFGGTGGNTKKRTVVLIDEVDLVFRPASTESNGDCSFYTGLSSYLSKAPPRHLVVMTSNAPLALLSRHISFPPDLLSFELVNPVPTCVHEIDPISSEHYSFIDAYMQTTRRLSYEGPSELFTSIDNWHGPDDGIHMPVGFVPYAEYLERGKSGQIRNCQTDWNMLTLPVWSLLERRHLASEEERLMARGRRGRTASKPLPYLRSIPRPTIDAVLSL